MSKAWTAVSTLAASALHAASALGDVSGATVVPGPAWVEVVPAGAEVVLVTDGVGPEFGVLAPDAPRRRAALDTPRGNETRVARTKDCTWRTIGSTVGPAGN